MGEFSDHNCAEAGKEFVVDVLRRSKRISYIEAGIDRNGRPLVYVLTDGELLQYHLVNEGHAYETISHFGDNGWPKLGRIILDVSKSPKSTPHFEKPHIWKKKFK